MVPLITVLMSTYNDEKYVREAIESILDQTFQDFEFIIINDGSTDNTQNVIDSFSDSRIVVIRQENIGLTKSLNKGLKMARGEYIARQDADDISLPDRLEKQVKYLKSHPEITLLGGAVIRIDKNGRQMGRFVYPQYHEEIKERLYRIGNQFAHTAVMFRKEQIISLGGYNEFFKTVQDYELWLRISHNFYLHNLSDVLAYLRFHSNSISQLEKNIKSRAKYIALAIEIAEKQRKSGIYLPNTPYWNDYLLDFEARYKKVAKSHERRLSALQSIVMIHENLAHRQYIQMLGLLLGSIYKYPLMLILIPKRIIRYIWTRANYT